MNPPSEKATLRDVAQMAGVSTSTASRALRGHPQIKKETIEKIRVAATRLDYRPNLSARALVMNRLAKSPSPGLF